MQYTILRKQQTYVTLVNLADGSSLAHNSSDER